MTSTSERRSYGLFIGRPLGIPIYLSSSVLLLALVVTVDVSSQDILRLNTTPGVRFAVGMGAALLLTLSILLHELGHSAVALAMGIPIRRITLFLFGGVAEMTREPDTAAKEFLVSVAGPLVSFILAAIGGAGWRHFEGSDHLATFVLFEYLFVINLVLTVFNLLPGLPLDGGRVLRAGAWALTGDRHKATRVAARSGMAIGVLIGALAVYAVTQGAAGAIFTVIIALFVYSGARASLAQAAVAGRLPGLSLRSLTRPALAVVADLPLAEALRRAAVDDLRLLVVDAEGAPSALLSTAAVEAVPAERRPWVSVGSVSRSLADGLVLDVELTGEAVLGALRATPASEYLVVDSDGAVVGVVAARDVARRLAPGKNRS